MSEFQTFADLKLSKSTLKGLTENKFIHLTDIQRQSIKPALEGNDILGAAKTGSGKTLAFLIPILELLKKKEWTYLDGIGALIVTPTRELALQIYETLIKVGKYHDFSAGLIIGGKDLKFEKKRIDKCNILICTPGRLLDHMDKNALFNCINMQILVLDEADLCLSIGFEQTMNNIIANLPPERQTLLFSATQTKSVGNLAKLSLKDPLYISVHELSVHVTPDKLQQSYIVCELEEKTAVLWSFITTHRKQKVIVFFSSCKQVKYMYEIFCRMRPGVSLMALYGTIHQLKRMKIYESFHRKQSAVLFATDIAARGLDFPDVNWVIQMDCPEDVDAYIHRAGRTARFQNGGESLLVLLPSEQEMVNKLKERKIPISMIRINLDKLNSPQRKFEAQLARDVNLKESAQRAFVAYIKSVFLMKDKSIFNVHSLNTDAFARSLGLAIPPRIRFLQKNKKNCDQGKDETDDKSISLDQLLSSNNTEESISIEKSFLRKPTKEIEKKIKKNKTNLQKLNDSDDENSFAAPIKDDLDDLLVIKRKNIQLDVDESENLSEPSIRKEKKPITKAAIAKKLLKKNIVPNKKTLFGATGEEIIDPSKSKVSALAQEYDNEDTSGINIEIAKSILKEEDSFDKKVFREKVKQRHRESKKKLKMAMKGVNENEEADDYCPDVSWLPDPDEIYGTQSPENDSDSDKSNISQSQVPQISKKSSKRENSSNKDYKQQRKKMKVLANNDLEAAEELALQLLQR